MTTDPIAAAARSVAGRLATEYGSGLAAEVDAALHTREQSGRPIGTSTRSRLGA